MADSLNMNGLSLQDSKHASNGMGGGRSTYIPPHLRGSAGGPPPMGLDGAAPPPMNGSAWGPPPG
jgi:ATP-dependent RNA helicase DDX3X